MYRILIVLFAVCVAITPAGRELESSLSLKSPGDIQSNRLQAYPSIERIVRAHLTPDGPSVEDGVPVNDHHLKRLTALSIREQTFRSFTILESGGLESLRMYSCKVEDFNSIALLSGIKELHLQNCQIEDISPLAQISGLTNLSLTDNHIKDITALSRCRGLAWLDLRNNRIESVSALRRLEKLVYVDLRDNPLGAGSDDIRAIKANNPGLRILLGKRSDMSQAHLSQQLSARAKFAEFALCARLQYIDGIVPPLLPNVPDEISEALTCLGKGDDKEYLVDIATLLMKYVIDVESYYRPGPILSRGEEPLVDAFVDGVGLKMGDEGIPALYIGNWVCENRNKLAPSCVLDRQIERRHDLLLELKRKGIYSSADTRRQSD